MKKNFIFLCSLVLLSSCSQDDLPESSTQKIVENTLVESTQLSTNQAIAYAKLFSDKLDRLDTPPTETRAMMESQKLSIENIDYIVEGGDTLMYAVNYSNNNGYILISGANTSFPIVAHSSSGNLKFDNIDERNPLHSMIVSYKERVKKELRSFETTHNQYFNEWKDLGKEGYEYEIELSNTEPEIVPQNDGQASLRRRKHSSGKKTIYPYTGKRLDYWCQDGGYNYYAKNKAKIGCPAIAIGMLMYDTRNRLSGNHQLTKPDFEYSDNRDISQTNDSTSVAKKLRYIADQIPNYEWGKTPDAPSGAQADNIVIGLRKLGYSKAAVKDYDFEELYRNLEFKEYNNFFGKEQSFNRGVLIGSAGHPSGHIWFCDGYYEQSYTVKKKFLGIRIKSWTEYDDRIYMNWGWGHNQGNGWYSATENRIWTSLEQEGGRKIALKNNAKIFINLTTYEDSNN